MEMYQITDNTGNSYLYDPNTGETYQEDGLGGLFDIFKKKPGGTFVGNALRNLTSSKNVQALVSKGAQSLTNKVIQHRNTSTGGAAPSYAPYAPYPTYYPQQAVKQPDPKPLPPPAKDNTMMYVAGGVGILAIAGIAIAVAKSKKKGK